jgi:hypothetical protein
MVFGFVRQFGGHISVYSVPGVGTIFRLFLPLLDADTSTEPSSAVVPLRVDGGHETVLVVEDDVAVRRVVVRQIAEMGYRVLEAASVSAALGLLTLEDVDVLLTDIIMPGELNRTRLPGCACSANPFDAVTWCTRCVRR